MHALKFLAVALTTCSLASPVCAGENKVAFTEYCMSTVFRETPYADIGCGRRVDRKQLDAMKHFELDYDQQGRLIEVRFVQSGKLRAYKDRFIRAPRTKITYQNNIERRHYFDELNQRTIVSGDVYETKIRLDKKGQRSKLTFHDIDGNPIENDFGIERYEWTTRDDGSVLEKRFDSQRKIKRNRPGFGYLVTEFFYNSKGLLSRMQNLGGDGTKPTPDAAGVVSTQISYDTNRQFTGWLNMGTDGNPLRGMSDIAEIRYTPSAFKGEEIATFVDADGSPQVTRWGAHRVAYEFDRFGNETVRRFYGIDGQQKNVNNGIGEIRSRWTDDGAVRVTQAYFDKSGQPVERGHTGVHAIRSKIDEQGRLSETSFVSLNGDVIVEPSMGYAVETIVYDGNGRMIGRRFSSADKKLSNHRIWGFAEVRNSYAADGSLTGVAYFNAIGEPVSPKWNPAH